MIVMPWEKLVLEVLITYLNCRGDPVGRLAEGEAAPRPYIKN